MLQKSQQPTGNNPGMKSPETGLVDFFEIQAAKNPDAIAVEFGDQKVTYRVLNLRANQLASLILKKNPSGNQSIGVCMNRSVEMVTAILAILKAGGAYVPIDPSYPADRIQYMVKQSGIDIILIQPGFEKIFESSGVKTFAFDHQNKELEKSPGNNLSMNRDPEGLAYVLFTSGSTGMPKGVAMVDRALVNLVNWQKEETNLGSAARTLQFAPVSFDVSFQEIFTTWSVGGTLVLISDDMRLNAIRLLEFINRENIERLFLPFIALQHLADVAETSELWPESLKDVITAGEQLQITRSIRTFFTKLPSCRLHNHYGPTESHVVTAYTMHSDPSGWVTLPPIGKEISNVSIYLLDEKLNLVKEGEEGEIYIGGVALARGYVGRDDLTAERFIQDPFNKQARIYKTGDIGKVQEDGNIAYLGRSDNQVKVRGYRIEPGEIEIALGQNPGISQVAVTVREDDPGDKRIVAYIVKSNGADITQTGIRNFISGKLPEYMIPSAFVFLDELPKTPSGKTDRKALPKPGSARPDIAAQYVAPSDATEKIIAELWKSLLKIDNVGTEDNFFDLGGNSLLALQFIARLQQEHNIDLSVVKLYQSPTIKGIVKEVAGKSTVVNEYEKARQRLVYNRKSGHDKSVEDGIAIIGMAGRFPGAKDVSQLWNNLLEGKDTTTFFSDKELDPYIDTSVRNDASYVKARGIIDDADKFDAAFFGVNPRLAELMDPQQRVFLEICWEALENAGYASGSYDGMIGVFAGMGNNTYFPNNVLHHKDSIEKAGSFQVMVGNEKDYIATRISHFMNLRGPGISVNTACSTSLTAISMACQNLWSHQCDMALSGGISITSPVNSGHIYQEGGMFSNDGHTRPFDASAQGTVFSDGGGVVVLKRYKDAVNNGDTIYAVIRGVGINNDGSEKASFTAPSVSGQAAVIAMAQADANVSPESISYIETHGTATPLGDPIEIEGLTQAFRGATAEKQFCAVGSIKSNFGHLTAAAGVAGLIKTALSLHHKIIPATIHYKKPNPSINFNDTPFFVNAEKSEWKVNKYPRRAGVSSFGVGGTNSHVILEEAPEISSAGLSRSHHLLVLSAKSKEALEAATINFERYLKNNPSVNLADAAYTMQTGRATFAHRRYVVGGSVDDMIQQLEEKNPLRSAGRQLESPSSGVAFMFPGQGSQYVNMGAALYRDEVVFREAVDMCAMLLVKHINTDIRSILYPAKGKEEESASKLQETQFTQPALFTIGYALSQLWMSWGIQPAALIGHSIGEFAAACISGIMSLEDAIMLVAQRGKLMQALPAGVMYSVRANAKSVMEQLPRDVSIAAINGDSLCVISGDEKSVDPVIKLLESKEIVCRKLFTSHAFHSAMMDPVIDPFRKLVASVKLNQPTIPVMSTATSKWLTSAEATDPQYWAQHLRLPVQFAGGIKNIWSDHPAMLMLEMGPRNTATILARQQATDLKKQVAVPSLSDTAEGDAESISILNAIGQLWLNGISIKWDNYYVWEKRRKIPLPTYPFTRKRFWVDPVVPVIRTNHFYNPATGGLPSSPEHTMNSSIDTNITMNQPSRKERLIRELRSVMEDASGIDLSSADSTITFMELGMDSLFLTQAALTISKKYGTKVTFRQLNEKLSSLDLLATHLDKELPAEQASPVVSSSNFIQPSPAVPQHPNADQGTLQWLITQQLQVMQQQLAMVNGAQQPVYNPPAPPPVAATTSPAEINENEKAELAKPFGAIARIEKSVTATLSVSQENWLKDFTDRYNFKTKKSKEYTRAHRSHLADPRVVTGFKPSLKELIYQVVVDRSNGCRLWDLDGNEYIDVLNGFGSNFLGYGSPVVMKAVNEQLSKGIELGPQHPLAGEVAKLICEFTGYDRAGFCNTGSEAVLGAMRIARTVTGRNLIVCFNGSYHGINDEVIVRGTKKLKSFPASAGIMPEAVENMLVLDYGTDEALEIIKSRASEIAAVMVEPIQSRRADFTPFEFNKKLRELTTENECLLIYDEVITGFRLHPGGAQAFYNVKADLGTYGKVIGGGMPIGVIAGRKEFMDALDGGSWNFGDASVPETGVTYFAGTFVRHPLALAAAKAVLLHLKERGMEIYEKLNGNTSRLVNEINRHAKNTGAPFHLVTFGSLFKVKWDDEQPYNELLFLLLREKGVHIYDGFPCFVTDAFTDEDISFVISQFINSIDELQRAGFLTPSTVLNGSPNGHHTDKNPPVPGARLGKDQNGLPGWFIPDPDRPGKYKQVVKN